MKRNDIYFKLKKYKWGWSLWFKADSHSILLGSKLTKGEAENIIQSIMTNPKINYEIKEYPKKAVNLK